jgi:hypothetical protein
MDSIFVNLIAGDIYKKCFREVVPRDRPVEQADQDELDNCINKFHESYKIVTGAFVNFVKAQPSKAFKPDED